MPFPAELTNAMDGVTEIVAAHLNNLEAKVGIDNSAVATTLDYLLKNAGSIDPGHKHTAQALSGGNNGEILYKAAGVWGPGTPEAAALVAKSGDQEIAGVKTFTSIPVGPGSNPTTDNQLARKAYVDLRLPLAGGTMAGNIAMGNHKITGLAAASGAGEALRYDEWTAGQDPGHKHSKLWASDGSPEAVTVDATGNVGIGTTSPQSGLHVYKAGTGYVDLVNIENPGDPGTGATRLVTKNSVASFYLQAYGSTAPGILASAASIAAATGSRLIIGAAANLPVQIYANNQYTAPQITLDTTGYLGIGTTSPGKKLDVNGYVRGAGIFNTLNSAPADGDLAAGECAWWFDKTNGAAKFMIKAKQNDGTVKTASISLS